MPVPPKSVFASLPQTERARPKVISGDPKGKNFLYTNGKCVIIRDIRNPAIADIYTEHAHQVNVAKYSPSGFYIASGDAAGKIRIWDTTQAEHILKYEYTPISCEIKDLSWTEDNRRLSIVGNGRDKFAAAILWDTGSSVGDLLGHTKTINSVDTKPTRPYRIVTGSDDFSAKFFEGPPFKFKHSLGKHENFVNCVRFSPDGKHFVTAGADGKIFIYDGSSGEPVGSLCGESGHKGGVYAISWSGDGTRLISASGDKTVKLWDVHAENAVTTFNMGNEVADQQVGCLWQDDFLLSISCSGYINYLDQGNPDRPARVIKGHNKAIQCLTVHNRDGKKRIYSGDNDGHITDWDVETGENDCFSGKGHTNQVNNMAVYEGVELVTSSLDDTLRFTNISQHEYRASDVVKLGFQPKHLSIGGTLALVVCIGELVLLRDKKKVFTQGNLGYEAEVGAIHPGGATAAVAGADGKIRLYSIQGDTLKAGDKTISVTDKRITDMAYSNDGAYLGVIDESKVTSVFTVADGYSVKNLFYGHHAKPCCFAWSPDNEHFATAGLDMLVCICDVADSNNFIKLREPHRMHHVVSVAWLDAKTLVTTSHDAVIKQWTVPY
ncbi:WD repeat-containing protein 1 [Brachionichthys hirsutus]|uniref:WD repeat-containing protein 1 n=1 Tax=Brachionichthys hirsutus TaxID=412623 RepID=UPI003604B650